MSVQPGFTIAAGGYVAEIARTGAGLRGLRRDGVALTEEWPLGEKPPLSAGLVLAPWPGRTEDGLYTWDGEVYRLAVTSEVTGTADHGLVRRVDWDDVEIAADAVTLVHPVGRHPGWPFDLHLRIRYGVTADGLTCSFEARNDGDRDLPLAVGFHTYLRIGDDPVDACTLELGAGRWQPLDGRLLPDGPPRTVDGTAYDYRAPRALDGVQIDTPFTDVARTTVLRGPSGEAELWTAPSLPWAQVFIADPVNGKGYPGRGRALAVEPMSAPGNALHTGTDVIRLVPGAVWATEWGIR
ncbi:MULTISPECIES: aldose 1-epimerase family protein [Tsukamurella]|uniref:Aldose 1-epimerase family protein n=2 Tax=Tsukamurella TaxID=2060 RepID=A0A5C5S572_9ACTN|nr:MULTISPECIES: aldose 1-epimerase family protein [Tsukamurella]NMD58462.1 aldose 1-epimerase family protein [Tsukamurella columbiensis]TWS30022.1 aldose 1-epimerase family protein [Tsukamurella conjunctivitidis]